MGLGEEDGEEEARWAGADDEDLVDISALYSTPRTVRRVVK